MNNVPAAEQIDGTYWRQDCYNSQENCYRIQGFPQSLQDNQLDIERSLRSWLQEGAQINNLRCYLYNQMAYNNYNNQDWTKLVVSTGEFIEYLVVGEGKQGTRELVDSAIDEVLMIYILRAVENNQALRNYVNSQAMANELNNAANQRDRIGNAISQFQNRNNQGWRGNGGGYNHQQQQQFRQQALLSNTMNNRAGNALYNNNQKPQSTAPGGLGGRSSAMITRAPTEEWNSESGVTVGNVQAPANTRRVGWFHGEDSPAAPAQQPRQNIQAPIQPVQQHIEQERHPADEPTVVRTHAMVEIFGIERPMAHNVYRQEITQTGEVMNIEQHRLGRTSELPLDQIALNVYDVVQPGEDKGKSAENSFSNEKLRVINEGVVGVPHKTAVGMMAWTYDALGTGTILEFNHMNLDCAFVPDREKFLVDFAGLTIDTPTTDITELHKLVKATQHVSEEVFKFFDGRATAATNSIIREVLGLKISISSFAEDFPSLPAYLRDKYGQEAVAGFSNGLIKIVTAVCCIAAGALDTRLRDYCTTHLSITKSCGVVFDPSTGRNRAMTDEELEAHNVQLAKNEELLNMSDNYIQFVDQSYNSLIPVDFDRLGIDFGDKDNLVLSSATMPSLVNYLENMYRRAGGDNSMFSRRYIHTIDGTTLDVTETGTKENRRFVLTKITR